MRRSLLLALCWVLFALPPLATPAAADGASVLPLVPQRRLDFVTDEGTWMALDVSPDGRTILFDLLGDIYALDFRGGPARPLLRGVAFESNPVFAPDGKRFAFISDRSGSNNLWLANIDGSGLRQLTHDTGVEWYTSPAWSPDGRKLYVSRSLPSLLGFELYAVPVDGGTSVRLTNARPDGNESFDERRNALGVTVSPDGRYLYYATKTGGTWTTQTPPAAWSITRMDLHSGEEEALIRGPGSAMRPLLSHDGRKLAYASSRGLQTGLRLRDLETGEDRWLAFPIDRDGQDGGYYADLMPPFAFTPDDQAIVFARDGGIQRLALDGSSQPIPFSAQVQLEIGPALQVEQREDTGPVRVRVIHTPRLSPDGRSIAFAALGALYVQALRDGAVPQRLDGVTGMAWQPAWSPDGRQLVYVTWTAGDGGQIWTIAADGRGPPQQLTTHPAYYSEPTFTPDGRSVVALRATQHDRVTAQTEYDPKQPRPTDLVRMPSDGGEVLLIAHAIGARAPSFGAAPDRVYFQAPAGLSSIGLDGADLRRHAQVKALPRSQYVAEAMPVEEVKLSPRGDRALARIGSQLYLVEIAPGGIAASQAAKAAVVDLSQAGTTALRLTEVGADYFDWADDGRTITWSVGSTFRRIALDAAVATTAGAAERQAQSFAMPVEVERDVPRGALLLRGATAITMRGDEAIEEVIENSDVLVVDNRIAALGRAGEIPIPAGTVIRDVTGKYLLPGFVDTHAHWFETRREILDRGHWDFLANLAYGVTAGLDVQPFDTAVFGYQDMIDTGMMIGPRAYSTGPGVFRDSAIHSKDDALRVLRRYRDHYRTRNLKAYMVGNRAQRQFLVAAAHELGMMPTTEGASDLRLDLTHALDGFAGNEHALPVAPLHDDVVQLFARSRIAYTPTYAALYGGRTLLDDMIARTLPQDDPKLRRFVPAEVIEAKTRYRRWMRHEDQSYPLLAAQALKIQRAGGLVGMGSHGEIQGLGYHWELEAYVAGGATPQEALHVATLGSAEVIGRAAEIGSLEPGKFADLLILDRDPRADIRNTRAIDAVMKNGRLYQAETLDELWPRQRTRLRPETKTPTSGVSPPSA